MKKKEIEGEKKKNVPWKQAAQSEKNPKNIAKTRLERLQE